MCISTVKASAIHWAAQLQRIATGLQKTGGVVRRVDHFGLRPLASRIRAHGEYHETGRYIRLNIQANPTALARITAGLQRDEDVIRLMVIKNRDIAPLKEYFPASTYKDPILQVLGKTPSVDKGSALDYEVAKELLRRGLITKEAVGSLQRHFDAEPYKGNPFQV